MDGCQTNIAGSGTIVATLFKVMKKSDGILRLDVRQIQLDQWYVFV
jgi:hypothetical protein